MSHPTSALAMRILDEIGGEPISRQVAALGIALASLLAAIGDESIIQQAVAGLDRDTRANMRPN